MTRRWLCAATCAAVLLSTAVRASAAPPDPQTLKEAQERLEEGNRLFHKGDYEGARVAYSQSLALVPHGATYRNLGTTELRLGDAVTALKHLRIALSDPELDAKRKVVTKKDFDAAYAATGHVAVATSAGASLSVDGRDVEGTAPLADAIDVTVGKHTLEAHLRSQSAKVEVEAKAGQVSSVEISIPPAPSPPPPVASDAPPSSTPPSVASRTEAPLPDAAPEFWSTRRTIGVGVAGAGLVALGISAYFFADSNSQSNLASSLAAKLPPGACSGSSPPVGCTDLQNALNAQSTDVTLRSVFFVAGAAAVVVGGGLFFWPSPNHSRTALVPFFAPGSAGLQLRGEL